MLEISLSVLLEFFLIFIVLVLFGVISYLKKALDFNGVLFGVILGIAVYVLGGVTSFLLITLFFIIAEYSTRYSRMISPTRKEHEVRTTGNVLGNAGAALLALVVNPISLNIAFFGAIAAALSDTLSSEIGLLSKSNPRLITTMKKVAHGVDGGVTFLGFLAALAGAGIIGFIFYMLSGQVLLSFIIAFAGFCGSLIDSFLGAIFEGKGILNNTSVNFLASLSGACITVIISFFLGINFFALY